ncbi:MAG: response regulator transcription factor [Clostridia bacterium]|nr:response regulator transcription factor [Clostridia bacterium]
MEKILVVDDEEKIRDMIKKYAEFEGYAIEEATDGMDAVIKCRKNSYDLIIMDIMMPELDGFSAVKEIRKTKNTPVIMLSARGEEYDKIHGFEVGADDYVIKPFSPKELMMRVGAIIKRSKSASSESHDTVRYDGLTVDFTSRTVCVNGEKVEMTPKECELLFYFIRNEGIALTRERLITEVWGYGFYGDDRTLDSHIKLLRKSLGEYSRFIVTLRSVGYRFDGEKKD